MAEGLNGYMPVAADVALMLSEENACMKAHPNMPVKLAFVTGAMCKSSNLSISVQNSCFILLKQTMSSPCRTWVQCGGYPKMTILLSHVYWRSLRCNGNCSHPLEECEYVLPLCHCLLVKVLDY